MATDDVREQAKAIIRRQVWESRRGIATRSFIRAHPELVKEYEDTGTIAREDFPEYVTKASVLLELNTKARRRESVAMARKWAQEHPEEFQAMRAKIQQEISDGHHRVSKDN